MCTRPPQRPASACAAAAAVYCGRTGTQLDTVVCLVPAREGEFEMAVGMNGALRILLDLVHHQPNIQHLLFVVSKMDDRSVDWSQAKYGCLSSGCVGGSLHVFHCPHFRQPPSVAISCATSCTPERGPPPPFFSFVLQPVM